MKTPGGSSAPPEPEDLTTFLLPCKVQRPDYLAECVGSVLAQTDPCWRLLVIVDEATPAELPAQIRALGDARIEVVRQPAGSGFAGALNYGLERAGSEWVAILLSDDRLSADAVDVLRKRRRESPEVDFFYSSRRDIDAEGRYLGPPSQARAFAIEDFWTYGSRVKHLLCWRRSKALAIGGFDPAVGVHGCDDYDFPWRMAEAGCVFEPVAECLYEYRVHTRGERLTTGVGLDRQIDTLGRMFAKHGVPAKAIHTYVQGALRGYMIAENRGGAGTYEGPLRCYSEWAEPEAEALRATSRRSRRFFAHRVDRLRRAGPDGLKVARKLLGEVRPEQLRQLTLYALSQAVPELPPELFFDPDVQWHQQHCGRPFQVAWANVAVFEDRLAVTAVQSDLVQRIGRAPAWRTRVDNDLGAWASWLWNAVAAYAADLGLRQVHAPSAALVLERVIPAGRRVGPELFERTYDDALLERFTAREEAGWRVVDVEAQRDRIVPGRKRVETPVRRPTICVFHDVERDWGHRVEDPPFAERVAAGAPGWLEAMLAAERRAGVRATYNVVGAFLPEVREAILAGGHALAFHSFDHTVPSGEEQLWQCREVDYRLKGYRPPQSRTEGLTDDMLCYYNFEWLASSAYSLGFGEPRLDDGVAKLPVHLDDYGLYQGSVSYDEWEEQALATAGGQAFTAIGLHDCYAELWLPHYEAFLRKLGAIGELRTLDEAAGDVFLDQARWV